MNRISGRAQILLGIVATLLLTGLSLAAVALFHGASGPGWRGFPAAGGCSIPNLPGTVVNVATMDMAGRMMGGGIMGGGMRLAADRATVAHGEVTFLVTNVGQISHEMVILPLSGTRAAGTRPIGGDGQVDEAGSLGEASATCAEGEGQGILPRTAAWVTVNLPAGRYELVCNLPGHYQAGMYTQLTVT
ncbi:hypothetical protein LVY72_06930 [Arthrobacter sp. I2-34]|uniref:Sulfocyanin-like C-terminal domain-containing protein n=1 Tax=Arthrobacter hankyongi TaxID=2904801 RepID=A0ABS9L4P0_9MICC|nr:sulfocyanin-like copper-binding protein [Arthrobacter hankyongi]MCG2621649.1 hypothetical protein [Arthrobacter hankyongi]